MPTVLACLRRTVERMWPPRVPTRFGPGTRLRRPKNQWNQGPLATPQAEMCPRTANSGLELGGEGEERGAYGTGREAGELERALDLHRLGRRLDGARDADQALGRRCREGACR